MGSFEEMLNNVIKEMEEKEKDKIVIDLTQLGKKLQEGDGKKC